MNLSGRRDAVTRFVAGSGLSWRWLLLAIALRIVLTPLQHTWDSQTWWNALAQIGAEPNPIRAIGIPFDSARAMTDLARGSGQSEFFEYWAYPPGILMFWWPVARLWTVAFGPLTPHFWTPGTLAAAPIPLLLSFGFKLPVILGDVACGLLLACLGTPGVARIYLLNPYVLLAGLWTFDPLMVAFLLAGVLAARRERWGTAGALLGVGAAIKFVPALLVPVVCLWAIRRSPTPLRSACLAGATSVAAFGAICLPWKSGMEYVIGFQASRVGSGMGWQSVWNAIAWLDPLRDLRPVQLFTSPQVGFLMLTGTLVITTWLAWLRGLDLLEMSLAVMLAYLLGSKLVNEVYVLPAMGLALVVFTSRPGTAATRAFVSALWLSPLLFALVNVPVWGFFVAPAEALGLLSLPAAQQYFQGYALTYQLLAPILAVWGALFQLLCAGMIGYLLICRGRPAVAEPVFEPPVEPLRLAGVPAI